jgi:hypothetical protein
LLSLGGLSDCINAEFSVLIEPRDPDFLVRELERAIVDLASDSVSRETIGKMVENTLNLISYGPTR